MYLSAVYTVDYVDILDLGRLAFLRLEASNKGGVGKTTYFEQNASISRKRYRRLLLLMTSRKLHKWSKSAPRSMAIYDLEQLYMYVRIIGKFRGILQILVGTNC